jgi:hypothetical protein
MKKMLPMYLSTYVLIGLIEVVSSCKDDQPSPAEQKPACLLTSITYGSNENKYEYDANGKLIKSISPFNNYIKYEYKDNRVMKLTYYRDNDESKINEMTEIQYNSKGQWIIIKYTISNGLDSAIYDASGNRTKIIRKSNNKLGTSYSFEYLNGNLTKLTKYYYNTNGSLSFASTYTYEYDLKRENMLVQFESLIRFGYLREGGLGQEPTPSKNMLKTVNTLSPDNSTISTNANLDYVYNDKGFPLIITVSGGDLNGDGQINSSDIFVSNFQYLCN